ncbi:MAG: molybdopterin molybdotransferase MoeA [Gemmatimonadaceae bacterium]|nr:molybdopterin molybdotransferase MoeA [Gemmatimonadaceae bacterium]
MITVAEASARILECIERMPFETVALANAAGRVLAGGIAAPITSPPWDNSSMDGYAVRSADLIPGIVNGPVRLRVVAAIAAGKFAPRPLCGGEAMRIMTGAPIPEGADTVIRKEDTDEGTDTVSVGNLRDLGRNVRAAGEDFRAGDALLAAGQMLRAPQLGVLASAGVRSVEVVRAPRVAIISSGDELVELDDFTPKLAATKIVSSNSLTLAALVREAGGEPVYLGIARDDPENLRELLEQGRGCDLIVTSAGLSVGDHDHVRGVFEALGGKLGFWRVRMRPGAPLAFGTLGRIPWIGLSGNPVSAIVTFEVFVRPAIRKMLGLSRLFRQTIPVRVEEPITLNASLMHFLRAFVVRADDGSYAANLAGAQSSAVLTSLARANALLILPGDKSTIEAGETHRAMPLGDDLDLSDELRLT